jgi:hypothetical protein
MMSTKIKRALRIAVGAYLSGGVVVATYLVWSVIDGGIDGSALERQQVRVLSSDLNFIMDCKDREPSTLEGPIEEFLRRESFDVLNRASIQRRHNWFSTLDVEIIGLNKARRLIHFRSPRAPKDVARLQGHYFVELRTPPPTQRAPEVEDALLKFATEQLQCGVRQVIREENGADVADLYESEIRRVKNLFREADQLNGPQPR